MSNSETTQTNWGTIIGIILFIFIAVKISNCRRDSIADKIMNNDEYRDEHDIRNRKDAIEEADEIIDAQNEMDAR